MRPPLRATEKTTGYTAKATPRVPQAARNVIANWMTYLVSGGVSFFLSPFIVHHLGNSAYGVWVLLVSLTGYLGFLDLGIRGAVTRYVAKFHSEGAHEQSSYTVSSACGLFITAGFLAVLASILFAIFAIPHFEIPPAYSRAAQIVVVITGLNIALSLVSGVFGGVLVGLQRFDLTNSIAVGGIGFRTAAIVMALKSGHGLITLALIQLVGTIGELVLGVALSRLLYPQVSLAIGNLRRAYVSLIFSFGFFAFLLHLSNYLVYFTDALVIGSFLPVSMVTFFSIGSNLTIYARDLVGGFSRTMTPLASKLEVENGLSALRETSLKAARFCAMAMWPIFVTFIIRGHSFIGLWMGPSYADLSGHVLWILSIPWLFGAGTSVIASVMLGISQHKRVVPVALAEGLGNLVLSIALVKPMGIVGVAWGTAIPNLAVSILFWPWYTRRTLGIPIREYVRSLWLLPAVSVLPFCACTYVVNRFWSAHTLFFFFLQVAIVLPVALAGIWYLGLMPDERRSYGRRLAFSPDPSIRRT
jgi:O-antigen/teichoic acid export membrane protein